MKIDQFPNFRTPKILLLRWKRLLYAEGISLLETALISRIDTKIALVVVSFMYSEATSQVRRILSWATSSLVLSIKLVQT